MILPFLWMVLTAFKTYAETVQIPIVWFPKTWTLENFEYVLTSMNFLLYYKNSVIMVVGVIAGQLFVCSLAGYAFARIDFKFRSQLFLFLMAVLMVPGQMTIIAPVSADLQPASVRYLYGADSATGTQHFRNLSASAVFHGDSGGTGRSGQN